jgi:hypothetical protein
VQWELFETTVTPLLAHTGDTSIEGVLVCKPWSHVSVCPCAIHMVCLFVAFVV